MVHDTLEATLEELARVGYVALTFEAVAARAKVNRTTIYRRWPTKHALVHDALVHAQSLVGEAPDTGAVRSDLMEVARYRLATMSLPHARAIAAAIISEPPESELVAGARLLGTASRAMVGEIVARGIARGELPKETDPELIHQPLLAVLFAGAIMRRAVPDEAYLTRLIDGLVVGAAHDAATRTTRTTRERRRPG
ncbi:MAG: hypothetical protein QOI41_5321 [Myxococcales bacterium]|nr:hypothetical protein [Myxococcales bacterium]